MHTKRIIPCLDVNNGQGCKGYQFCEFEEMQVIRLQIACCL